MADGDVPTREQFRGCLVGQCLADALASRFRGNSPEICQDYFRALVQPWLDGSDSPEATDLLLITDGSQLACELLRSFNDEGDFLPERFAERLTKGVRNGRVVHRYLETHLAAKHLGQGASWQNCAVASKGAGSAHRAAAAGLINFHDPAKVALAATLQSDITHAGREARAASVAVSGLVAAVMRGQSGPDRDQLVLASASDDPEIEGAFNELDRLVKLDPSAALAAILSRSGGREPSDGLPDEAIPTILWSLYAVVHSDWDYARALEIAIGGGGEMTAAAAIAGAICGAARGIDALPQRLIAHVSNQGVEGLAEFVELADQCQRRSGTVCRPA